MAHTIHVRDISWCQPASIIQWLILKLHIHGLIIRMGQANWMDSEFLLHWKNVVQYKILAAVYWFFQPDMDSSLQYPAIKVALEKIQAAGLPLPGCIYFDVEPIVYTVTATADGVKVLNTKDPMFSRYKPMPSDLAHVKPGAGDGAGQQVSIFPPDNDTHSWWLSKLVQWMAADFPDIRVGFYTRKDYWDLWVRPSGTEAKPAGSSQKYTMPIWGEFSLWAATWLTYLPGITEPLIPRDWQKNTQKWDIWQDQGGDGRCPGIGDGTYPVDHDYHQGTWDTLKALFKPQYVVENAYNPGGSTPPPEVPPEVPLPGTIAEKIDKLLVDVAAIKAKLESHFK